MKRIRLAWMALRGAPVLASRSVVAVSRATSGDFGSVEWVGMTRADAAKVLYQAADAIVEQMPAQNYMVH